MIPVSPRPEPANFHQRVRTPGLAFLSKFPNPTPDNWKKGGKIWCRALDDLFHDYNRVCAYSAEWVTKKERSVDHYVPRTSNKALAFEWSNFRLASQIINQFKGASTVIDPFLVGTEWFVIDFESNIVKPNSALDDATRNTVLETISILKINGIIFQNKRTNWIDAYYKGRTGLNGLRKKAPFLVYEIERQDLVEGIKEIHERFLVQTGKL